MLLFCSWTSHKISFHILTFCLDLYRPQRSCGQGNVFTGVSLSTGGEGVCLSACWDAIPPSPQPREIPWDQGDPPGPGRPPWTRQTPPDQADPPDQGEPPWDQGDTPREADSSIRSTSSRYASYLNAFLSNIHTDTCK